MKFKNPLLVVSDMDISVKFYKEVLGRRKIMDFGENVTLTGGVCLQTKETWAEFIENESLSFGGKTSEIYFEEDDVTETYKLVTTVRSNSLKNLISRESPLGAAIFGHKVGDRCEVHVNDNYSYFVQIKRIVNTMDDGTDELRKF